MATWQFLPDRGNLYDIGVDDEAPEPRGERLRRLAARDQDDMGSRHRLELPVGHCRPELGLSSVVGQTRICYIEI